MAKKARKAGGLPRPTDAHDRKLLADVRQYGWHVIAVAGDEEGPGFAYSVGLFHTLGHPEVILFGLRLDLMHLLINEVGRRVKDGERFEHLDEADELLEGYSVCCRGVERRHYAEYLGYARWLYRGDDFPALQVVWPDSRHRYPWHPAAPPELAERQPLLSDERSWPFHEGKNRAAFTTRPVLEADHPILLVCHDEDGDWQFLCGTTNRPRDGRVVALGEILKRDPSLAQVADLPEGWRAYRDDAAAPWVREEMEPEEA